MLTVHYRSDPRFERMTHDKWLEFCRVHGVYDDEFRAAWRKWRASQRRNGMELVN